LNNFLVTGASSGIGKAVATELATKGENLILVARRKDRLLELQSQCRTLGSAQVDILELDLTDLKETETRIQKWLKNQDSIRPLHGLINAAGLALGVGSFQNSTFSETSTMIQTNVTALMHLTHLCLPSLIQAKGQIVNLGSVAGRLVYEGGAVYCATKFAIRAFSEGLRLDLKGTGVRVTNIEPGMVETEFSVVRTGSQEKADAVYHDMMPLTATDIARTIIWCCEQPPHVNIQELVIYPTDQASVGHVVRGEKSIGNLK
jgi:NADP-dependent 3-hydroxy acid dehydrogenase YdfG